MESPPLTEASLQALIAQTDAVASAIAKGEWDSATRMEVERRRLLRRFLEREARMRGGLSHVRETLAELQSRGRQFTGEVQHHRDRIIREACTVRKGRDAVKKYDASR